MGVFDWARGAHTILDHVQTLAQTENRLPLHPYDMVHHQFNFSLFINITDHDTSISVASPLVGLALALTHQRYVCSLLDLFLNGG